MLWFCVSYACATEINCRYAQRYIVYPQQVIANIQHGGFSIKNDFAAFILASLHNLLLPNRFHCCIGLTWPGSSS